MSASSRIHRYSVGIGQKSELQSLSLASLLVSVCKTKRRGRNWVERSAYQKLTSAPRWIRSAETWNENINFLSRKVSVILIQLDRRQWSAINLLFTSLTLRFWDFRQQVVQRCLKFYFIHPSGRLNKNVKSFGKQKKIKWMLVSFGTLWG